MVYFAREASSRSNLFDVGATAGWRTIAIWLIVIDRARVIYMGGGGGTFTVNLV